MFSGDRQEEASFFCLCLRPPGPVPVLPHQLLSGGHTLPLTHFAHIQPTYAPALRALHSLRSLMRHNLKAGRPIEAAEEESDNPQNKKGQS